MAAAGGIYISVATSSVVPSESILVGSAIALIWLGAAAIGTFYVLKGARWPWLIAIALHLAAWNIFVDFWPGGTDHTGNLELVRNMHAGLGYVAHYGPIPTFAYLPPGYPCLLAAWTWVFDLTQASVVALNLALDVAAAITIFMIIRDLAPQAASACAFAYLIWPNRILSSLLPSKEGLALFLFCQLLFWVGRTHSKIRPVMIGVTAAGLALTQPAWVPAIVCVAIFSGRLRLIDMPAITLAGCAVMAPWWLHCYRAFGTFVMFTASGPLSMEVVATGNKFDQYPDRLAQGEIKGAKIAFKHAYSLILSDIPYYFYTRLVEAIRTLSFDFEAISVKRDTAVAHLALTCQAFYVVVLALASRSKAAYISRITIGAIAAVIFMAAAPFEFAQRHKEFLILLALLSAGLGRVPKLSNDALFNGKAVPD